MYAYSERSRCMRVAQMVLSMFVSECCEVKSHELTRTMMPLETRLGRRYTSDRGIEQQYSHTCEGLEHLAMVREVTIIDTLELRDGSLTMFIGSIGVS